MLHKLLRCFKFWGLVMALGLMPPVSAQIGYWSALGGSTPFPSDINVYTVRIYPNQGPMMYSNGRLYITFANHITELAVWNGSTWQTDTMPASATLTGHGYIVSMGADNNGNVYMAGNLTSGTYSAGDTGVVILKWDGANFTRVGNSLPFHPSGDFSNFITTLCKDSSGNIYAGGTTLTSGGYEYIAKWDGSNWSILDSSNTVLNVVSPDVRYDFDEGMGTYGNIVYAKATTGIVKWNGSAWVNIDVPNSHVPQSFVIGPTGNIYASFNNHVSMWNGNFWTQLGNYNLPNPSIQNIYLDPSGNIYAINDGLDINGNSYVAKWDGHNWSELGGTNNFALHANGNISSLAISATGDSIFALGDFTNALTADSGLPYVAVYTTLPPGRMFVYLSPSAAGCGNTGAVTTTIYQGTSPYTYSWSNGATTANIDSLPSSQYYVAVTDAHGLVATGDITVQGSTCQGLITGTLFVDSAGTCNYNGQQAGLSNVILTLSGNSQTLYATTDANGNYSFAVNDTGNYYLYIQVGNNSFCGNFTLCGNPNQTVHVGVLGDTVSGNNFALNPASSGYDLYLHPGWTSANPGFEKDYWVYFANNSPVPYTGAVTVAFKYDSNLTFISSDSAYTAYTASADSITWVVNNFGNNGWNYIGKVRFTVPATLPLNYQLQSRFWIYPKAGDCDSTNNYLQYYETVVGAHDPNYKEVSPSGNILQDDSVLTYTIHYQNTGTDSTYFIKITDMLSPYLDPATVRNLASSVPYSSFTISSTGLLTWAFVPYSLPDSIMDAQASQGFIAFSVKKKSEAPVRSEITNTASVYFDYAPPVVTNRVADSVVYPPCLATLYDTISDSICAGNIFYVGSHAYTQTGNFTDTLISQISGCDSIVTLHLTVNPAFRDTIQQSICAGDTFYFGGLLRTQSGIYNYTYSNTYGCTSTVTLYLTVNPINLDTIHQSIYSGDTFYFAGQPRAHTGTYYDTLGNVFGCDSIVILRLTVKPLNFDTLNQLTCTGSLVTLNSPTTGVASPYVCSWQVLYGDSLSCYNCLVSNTVVYQNSGYRAQVTDTLGDTVILHINYLIDSLALPGQVVFADSFVHCMGDAFLLTIKSGYAPGVIDWNDGEISNFNSVPGAYRHYYWRSGTYQISVRDSLGCTTIVRDTIPNMPLHTFTNVWDSTCSNAPYSFHGHLYDSSGVYSDTLSSVGGCDSVVILLLTVNPSPVVTFTWDSMYGQNGFEPDPQYPNDSTHAIYCLNGHGPPEIITMLGGNPPGGFYIGCDLFFGSNTFNEYSAPGDQLLHCNFAYTYSNSNGCSASANAVVFVEVCPLGITPITPNSLFTLYPNPADDYVKIDFDAAYTGSTIFVKDITGRALFKTQLSTSPQQIPTGSLPPGVYLVTLYNNRQVGARLLVKE